MENKKTPFSIRFIYWLTNIVMGLMVLVTFGILFFNIALFVSPSVGKDAQLHVNLPAKINYMEKGTLTWRDQEIKVQLVEATAKAHLIDTPVFILKLIAPIILVLVVFAVFLTWTFRRFMVNVKNGDVFKMENIALLKRLAYSLVGLWFVTVIYNAIVYQIVEANLKFDNIRFIGDFSDHTDILLVALLIWVLAHIFSTGLKLQEEKDLTI